MSARDSYGEGKADVATAYRMRAELDRLIGEPMTPEVKQAIKNYYTRWDTLLAASNALDKETTR